MASGSPPTASVQLGGERLNTPRIGGSKETTYFGEAKELLSTAYGSDSHAIFQSSATGLDTVVDYEPLKLSTFRVFLAYRGTVLTDPVLFSEQLLITMIFLITALPAYWVVNLKLPMFELEGHLLKMRDWVVDQEERMRTFAGVMTGLAAFLLSFYTSKSVSRWWTIRAAGVGAMKAAASELELLISQFVTREPQIIQAIRRYTQTSLVLIFLWRRKQLDEVRHFTLDADLLTQEEYQALMKTGHNLHEVIWSWQLGIVSAMYNEGKILSEQLLQTMVMTCLRGRMAVQLIHTHLGVKIPMGYVHLLGMLVKMHNLVLATIMGVLFGPAFKTGQMIVCCQLFCRTLILPFLFNAILLLNAELSDPFNGGIGDFPQEAYIKAFHKDIQGLVDATESAPTWLAQRMNYPDAGSVPVSAPLSATVSDKGSVPVSSRVSEDGEP